MRVLVLSDLFPPATRGGYEVECRDVVAHLRHRHEVLVLTSRWGRDRAGRDPSVLRELPWTGEGSRWESITAPLDAARASWITRRTLARFAPEVVYVWNGGGVPATALRTLQLADAPMLARVCEHWFARAYDNDQFTRHRFRTRPGVAGGVDAAMRLLGRLPLLDVELDEPRPVAVSWNSAFVRDASRPPEAFRIVHQEVIHPANARMTQLARIDPAPEPGRVLFVGRLDADKGAWVLVEAIGILARDHRVRATLSLVGDGTAEQREALRRRADAAGVGAQVTITGPLSGEAFVREATRASVWSVPSVWAEPAGMTGVEAALCRVPLVLSRAGGIPELFADGTQALFHEPGDAPGCAAAIADALGGGPLVEARVVAAFARARDLSFAPYLRAMDGFFDAGLRALAVPPAA